MNDFRMNSISQLHKNMTNLLQSCAVFDKFSGYVFSALNIESNSFRLLLTDECIDVQFPNTPKGPGVEARFFYFIV